MTESIPPELVAALTKLAETFGPVTVRNAAQQTLLVKNGRPALDDLSLARPWLVDDALAWLGGANLEQRGRLQMIATEVATMYPGYNASSTRDRLRGKLRRHRKPATILLALPELVDRAPLHILLEKIGQAYRLAPTIGHVLDKIVDHAEQALLQHRAVLGEPDDSLSLTAVIDAVTVVATSGIGAEISVRDKIAASRQNRADNAISEGTRPS